MLTELEKLEKHRQRATAYYYKVKDTPEYQEKARIRKYRWFLKHKDELNAKRRELYNTDEAYHQIVLQRVKDHYAEKRKDKEPKKKGRPKKQDQFNLDK